MLATGAWLASVPELKRAVVAVSSDMVATAPMPERLEEAGWTGGEAISNCRLMVHYYRTTNDGRIASARAVTGMRSAAGLKTSSSHRATARRESSAATSCALSPSPRAWRSRTRGEVDRPHGRRRADVRPPARCRSHRLRRRVLGNGVAPSLTAGKILASSALGRDDEWSGCGLNRGVAGKFPPEPVRWAGSSSAAP